MYAHTANRNWESNQILLDDGGDPEVCTDIAKQLVNGQVGKKLKVSKVKQPAMTTRNTKKERQRDEENFVEGNFSSFLLLSVNETFCNRNVFFVRFFHTRPFVCARCTERIKFVHHLSLLFEDFPYNITSPPHSQKTVRNLSDIYFRMRSENVMK